MTPLSALLQPKGRASRAEVIVASSAVSEQRWPAGHGIVVADRELPKLLKREPLADKAKHPVIVVTGKLTATLLRALRSSPPPLVIVTGEADPDTVQSLDALPSTRAIGPHATVMVGDGDTVAFATTADELSGLCRALGRSSIALAVAPTPAWLPQWLADRSLAEYSVAGYVDAAALDIGWARWARACTVPTVVVPLGVPTPSLSEPRHADLSAVVAAHALERYTGPVFPSPRVVAQVLTGLRHGLAGHDVEVAPADATIWAQARRALPMTGSVLGMDRPRLSNPSQSPTAAFLAQRALLRAQRARVLADVPGCEPEQPDDEGVRRAEQLLASAGEALTDHEAKVVLRGFSIEVTRQAVATSASGATGFAERIGYPVVLKALSPDLRRRPDIGAIELHLGTGAAVRRAYASIVDNVEQHAPTARLDGVLVAEMVPLGLDVHCGVIRLQGEDGLAIYGRTIEASTPIEPAMALLPLDHREAVLLAHAILTRIPVPGLRRAGDPDVAALAELLRSLARVAEHAADRIESIELTPARLLGDRTVVLDARITQRPHLEGR